MRGITRNALLVSICLWGASPAITDVGVTDACQDDVKELQDKIRDNKDDYTAESRRKASSLLHEPGRPSDVTERQLARSEPISIRAARNRASLKTK